MGDPLRAVIYCRISEAKVGDTTKVAEQERICREHMEHRGWQLADIPGHPDPANTGVFTDNSISAWKKGVKRPGWDKMLAAIDSGHAEAIVVFHGDRLVRQPRDLENLIDLAETKGIRLASPSGERNLDRRDDRAMLRVLTAFQTNESDAMSDRRKAQYERWRREGKVRHGGRGGRAFGFETDGITHIPGEAEILCEAARRILAGDSTAGVARDLAACGVVTPAGNPISNGTLTKMLGRPRYAGLMPDGISKAAWDPVLPRETWEMLQAELTVRSGRVRAPSNRAKYLLSGIARCGVCSKPLQISGGHSGPPYHKGYRCYAGCRVSRDQPHLDAYVTGRVVTRLNHPENPDGRIPEAPGLAAEFAALTQQRAELEEVLADHTRGTIPALLDRWDSLNKRLAELRDLAGDDARARLIRDHAGMTREEFEASPLPVQRSLVAACFEVVVLPASARGPGFRPEDVKLVPIS